MRWKRRATSRRILKLLATSLETNIRELEGKLVQILQTLRAQKIRTNYRKYYSIPANKNHKITKFDQKKVFSTICDILVFQ